MSIWFENYGLDEINKKNQATMLEHLDIKVTALESDCLWGSMPVDHRTVQPFGLLHGGASVVLAESLASIAGNLVVNPKSHYCVGLEINANHIRSVNKGLVHGQAKAVHLGGKTQVWEVKITDDMERLICISRMTLAVMLRKTN